MKILVNEKYKMIRVGEYVSADEDSGEFIIDTEACQLSKASLFEVCDANKITASKKLTQAEIVELIEEKVPAMKLATQDEKPDSLKVKELVEKKLAEGEDDEEVILMAIVQSGIKFKVAGKLYKQALIELGAFVSSKDRAEQSREILVAAGFEPETWDDVDAMINTIVEKVPATEYSQAYAQIRKYAKEFDIVIPKPVKSASAGGFRAKIYAWMVAHPVATKNEFFSWIVETNEKEEKLAEKYWPIFELGQKIAKATIELDA